MIAQLQQPFTRTTMFNVFSCWLVFSIRSCQIVSLMTTDKGLLTFQLILSVLLTRSYTTSGFRTGQSNIKHGTPFLPEHAVVRSSLDRSHCWHLHSASEGLYAVLFLSQARNQVKESYHPTTRSSSKVNMPGSRQP